MNGKGPQPLDGLDMGGGRIALMLGQAISWVERVELFHPLITGCFGQNGSCGNRRGTGIPADERLLREMTGRERPGIDEQPIWERRQRINGSPHGEQSCLIDIELVDLCDLDKDN
jgi:hypothetical protein